MTTVYTVILEAGDVWGLPSLHLEPAICRERGS
jgi:hypothetical protein